MKSQGLNASDPQGRRLTRRERREQERIQEHQTPHLKQHSKSRLSISSNVGLIGTILLVAAILAYAAFRTQATANSTGGLSDPMALNAGGTLLRVGQTAPNFTLKDVNGKTYNLTSQRGHPVLLEFFAVWCPVCQGEAPTMARITGNYAPRGVRVWSVLANPYGAAYDSSGRTDLTLATKDDLLWYARTFDVRHPQLIDPKFDSVNTYGVNAYPGLYVINAKGVITYASEGHKSYAVLSQQLNRALATSANA